MNGARTEYGTCVVEKRSDADSYACVAFVKRRPAQAQAESGESKEEEVFFMLHESKFGTAEQENSDKANRAEKGTPEHSLVTGESDMACDDAVCSKY